MNKDVIRKVYDAMSKEYDMAEDFDTFAQDIQNKDVARRVYDAMYDRYRMEEDFEEFYKDLTFMPSVEGVKTTESGSVVVSPAEEAPKKRITMADTLNASVPGMVSADYSKSVQEEQEKDMLSQEEKDQRAAMRERLQEDGTIDRMKEAKKEARKGKFKAFGEMLANAPQVSMTGVAAPISVEQAEKAMEAGAEYTQNKAIEQTLDIALDKARAGEVGGIGEANIGNGVVDLGLGLWDSATRMSTWDLGVSDTMNGLTIKNVLEKYESDPSSLTATENNLIDAMGMATAVQEAYADKVGVGYAVGESLPQILGFMASMHLNPASGLGKAAMAKAATKYGQQSVKKYVARALGDVAETAIMTATTGGGRVVADAIDRINGQSTYEIDDNGMVLYGGQKDQETVGDAIWKAIGSNFIENYTEALGEYFDPIMGVAKGVVGGGLRKVNLNKFADWLTDAKPSETASAIRAFREKAKFGGLFGEVMEEELGMAMNALFVGDNNFGSPDDPNSIFNPETQLTTILSCAIMTGVLNGAESIGNRGTRKKYENNLSATERAAQQSLGDKFTEIKGALDTATPEQMFDILNGVLTDQSYDLQQKRLLTEYAVARVGMQYYNTTEEEGRKQLTDAQRNIVDAYEAGRHAQLPQFYGINNAVMTAEQTINQMPHAEELWSVIELLDRAPINEHEQIMRDLTDGDRHLVNDYRANRSRMEGVVEGRAEQVENLVQEYADKMGKHAYQKADGTREVATGIVGDEVVFIDDINEFGDAFVHTTDGNRFGLKIKDISHLQVRKLDDMVNEFRQSTTTAVDNETQKNLEYPVEVQEPAQGVTVSTLDGKQWQVAQTDGETVELVGMLFDKKSGQWIPNSGDYRKMTRKQFLDWQKAELDRKKANTYEQGDELTFYVGGGEPISAEITGITPEGKYLVQIAHLVDGLNKSVVDEYTADELRNLTTYSNNVSANQSQNEGTPTDEIKQSVSEEVTDGQNGEKAEIQTRINEWLAQENLDWAEGRSLNEIIAKFGNELEPIARIPEIVKQYLGGVNGDYIYSGKGYFIDHAVNHHPELNLEDYANIQTIVSDYDDIKDLSSGGVKKIAFIKKLDKGFAVVAEVSEQNGKVLLHKTFFYRDSNSNRVPYKNKPSLLRKTSVDGSTTISPTVSSSRQTPNLSALDVNPNEFSSSELRLTEPLQEGSDLVPTPNSVSSNTKVSGNVSDVQENSQENNLNSSNLDAGQNISSIARVPKDEVVESVNTPQAKAAELLAELEADEVDENIVYNTQKAIDLAEEKRKAKPTMKDADGDVATFKALKAQWQAELEDAQRNVLFWNNVAKEVANARVASQTVVPEAEAEAEQPAVVQPMDMSPQPAKKAKKSRKREPVSFEGFGETAMKTANDIMADKAPQNGVELAAAMLSGSNGKDKIRLIPESFRKHTGYTTKEQGKFVGLFSSNGVSMERMGELVMQADREDGTNFFDQNDANAGLNAVLEVLGQAETMADINQYITRNREEVAWREANAIQKQDDEQEQEAKDAWYMEQYGATEEELIAYDELMNEIVSEYAPTEEELQNVYSIFAEQQLEYGNEGTTESISRPTDSREGQGETVDGDNAVGGGDRYAPVETAVYAEGGAAEAVAETDAAVRADADVESKPTANVFEMAEEAQKKRKSKNKNNDKLAEKNHQQKENRSETRGVGNRPQLQDDQRYESFIGRLKRLIIGYKGTAPTEEVAKIIRDFNNGKTLLARTEQERKLLKMLRVMTNQDIDYVLSEIEDVLSSDAINEDDRKRYKDAVSLVNKFKNRGERKAIIRGLTGAELGDKLPLTKIDELFEMYNSDADVAELYRRVRAIAEQIGLDFWFDDNMDDEQTGGYLDVDNRVRLNAHMLYSPYVTQQEKASVIVHEILHAVADYAIKTQKDIKLGLKPSVQLPKQVLSAANSILNIYEKVVKDNPLLVHEEYDPVEDAMKVVPDYGTSSAREMLMEIANPEFRDKLKQIEYNGRSVWQRIWDAIKSMFTQSSDVTNPTAYDSMAKALDVLINEFSVDAYQKYSGLEESARFIGSADGNLRFREKEEPKELIAVHNISEGNLKKVLEAGSFIMPSIAITKADMGHDSFGEISLLFDKSTINPSDRRNKVYGGDAWTPRFPRIGVKLNEKVVSRINKKAYELFDDRRLREIFSLSSEVYPDNIEKVISDYGVEGYYNKEWMKLAYLLDNGKKVKIPTKAKDYGIASEDIVRLAKEKGLSVKEIYEDYNFYKNNPDFVAQVKEARDEARLSSIPEEQRDEMRERMQSRPLSEAAFDSYIRGALEMENDLAHGGLKEIVDRQALRDLIEKKVKTDNAEYNKWVDNLFEGIVEKRGIRNNRDWYTPSGNLRPWGQLYDPATPANILKYMLAENEQGGSGGLFDSNIMGASAETYESIEEIREKGKQRLKKLPYEEYDEWSNSIADRMAKICDDFLSPSQKNSMGGAIDAKIEITNAVAKDKTAKGIYKHMKREYPNFTMEHAKQVEEIVKEIQEFATGYFEAKPQRLVSVNEVMAAVVPSNANKEIVDALKSNGIEVITYKKGDEEARKRVVKRVSSSMGIRFRDGKEKSLETALQEDESSFKGTAVSSDDGAKVLKDIDNAISEYENKSTQTKNFIGDVARALGIDAEGKSSKYATFEAMNGDIVTIRISDHNATVSNFDNNGEENGVSIVVSRRPNEGITNDGDAHVVEFFYSDKKLKSSEDKPLVEILKSIKQTLYSGEYKDNTGLAEREEVNDRLREGMGAVSDREVSYENDPIAKWQGKPRYYGKRAAAFAERERRRMENAAKEAAEMLGIEAEIVTDASTLQGRKAKAKGWYDINAKKVVVVVPNHVSKGDAVGTVLHEGVAHHGLRELFGDGFDAMLDNVYNNVAPELKSRIDAIAERTGVSTSVATEEYLASLAETTNFEEAQRRGWWQKIKSYFVDMLRKLSMPGLKLKEEITDNELRYLLWKSYKNLVEPNSYLRPLGYAEDVVKQKELKVGEYAEKAPATPMAADTSEAEEWAAVTMQRIEELEAQAAQLENEITDMEADRDADDESRYDMWEQQLEPLRKQMEDVYAELEGLYSLEAEDEDIEAYEEEREAEKQRQLYQKRIDNAYLKAVREGDWEEATDLFRQYVLSKAEDEGIVPMDYGVGYRGGAHSSIAKKVKEENPDAIAEAAYQMSIRIPKGSILVPMPSRTGSATYTVKLAEAIAKATNSEVRDVLKGKARMSVYEAKQKGIKMTPEDLGMYTTEELPKGKNIVIIDNVIDKGTTALAAVSAVKGASVVAYAYTLGDKQRAATLKLAEPVTYDDNKRIIPLSQRFNKESDDIRYRMSINEEEFDNTQREAVKNIGIVMPNLGDAEVNIVDVPRHDFTGTGKEAISKAREWANRELVGEHVANEGTKEEFKYSIDEKSVKKFLSGVSTSLSDNLGVHLSVLKKLPSVIDSSIEAEIHADYKKGEQRDANNGIEDENLLIHRLYGCARINGELYRVKTTIKERKSAGVKPYTYEVTKIELLDGSSQEGTSSSDASSNSISGAKLLKGVEKSYDKGKLLLDESKKVSENSINSEEIIAEVERESANLGVQVRIARSIEELPDEDTRKRAEDGKLKGYFDPRTGEVVVYLPNTENANDAKRTILHEIVGHKGLRSLIGEQQYDKAMLQLMYMLPADVRDAVLRRAERHGWNAAIAMDEYLAEQAERDVQPTWWGKVNAKIRALLRNLGYDVKLTDADVTYLLWRSRKKLQGDDLNDMAVNAILKQAARKSAEADAWNEQAFKDAEMRDFEQGAMQTLRHRIGDAQNEYDSTMKSMAFKQREAWQDSMRSLKVFMDILEKESGKKIVDFENAYMYENAMSSANLMEMQMFRHDVYGRLLKAIHEFMESGAKYEEVVDYMMAKHGLERNEKMARKRAEKEAEGDAAKEAELYAKYREEDLSGLTALTGVDNVADAEVAAMQMVTDFEAAHNTDLLWSETRACTQTILNISHDAGILSDEVYDELWNQYEYYIPLRGFDETTAEEMYTYVGDNKSPYNAPIKTARGRKSKADDPIATIATMAESAIVEANRNRLKQRFLYMVERHRTELASVSSVWVEKDPITGDCVARFANIPNDATPDEAAQAQKSFEERMEQLHEQEPERYYKASDKPNIPYRVEKKANEHEHQIIVKRNGKDVVITINGDPRVAQAINGLTNPEAVEGFSKFAGNVNRFLSANFTTRNPAFVVSNFVRDGFYTNSMVWVKEGPAYARRYNQNWIKATKLLPSLVSKYKKYESGDKSALDMSDPVERAFYEFMIHGGETGYTVINSVEDYKGIVSGDLRAMQGGVVGNAKKAMQAVGNMVDTFGRWAEDTSRFAAYMTSRQLGRTITKSIWDAKEISVNFNKKGSGRKMTQHDKGLNSLLGWMSQQGRNLYVFWNAGVQGLTNFGKAAKEHPGKMAGLVGAYFGLGMLVAAVFGGQDDDDDYYNLPEYVRRNNICHRVGDKWITLPLPIEIRAIYGMGELAMSWIAGKEDPKKIGMKIVQQVSQVAPIDMMAEGGGLKAFIPSWFKPIAEVYINTDWTGMPIYRERTPFNEYDPTWMLAFKSTSPEYVAVSRAINEATNENLPSGKENKYDRGWADSDYFNNPAAWEHVVEGYLGGLATTFNQTKKSVMALWNKNLREMRNIPVISRFVKSTPENEKNTLRNDYFEAKDEVDKLRAQRGRFRKESKNIDKSLTEEQLEDVLESLTEMEGMVNATISKWDELEKNRKSLEQILKEDPEKKITIKGKEWKVSDLLDGVTKEMITLVEAYRME